MPVRLQPIFSPFSGASALHPVPLPSPFTPDSLSSTCKYAYPASLTREDYLFLSMSHESQGQEGGEATIPHYYPTPTSSPFACKSLCSFKAQGHLPPTLPQLSANFTLAPPTGNFYSWLTAPLLSLLSPHVNGMDTMQTISPSVMPLVSSFRDPTSVIPQ